MTHFLILRNAAETIISFKININVSLCRKRDFCTYCASDFEIITKCVIFNDKYCMIDYWTENYENRCISDGNVLKISGMFCFLSTYVIRLHTIKVNNKYMQWFWVCFGLQTTCKYYHFPYQILTYDLTLNTINKPPVIKHYELCLSLFNIIKNSLSSW